MHGGKPHAWVIAYVAWPASVVQHNEWARIWIATLPWLKLGRNIISTVYWHQKSANTQFLSSVYERVYQVCACLRSSIPMPYTTWISLNRGHLRSLLNPLVTSVTVSFRGGTRLQHACIRTHTILAHRDHPDSLINKLKILQVLQVNEPPFTSNFWHIIQSMLAIVSSIRWSSPFQLCPSATNEGMYVGAACHPENEWQTLLIGWEGDHVLRNKSIVLCIYTESWYSILISYLPF